jgi:hypothetical protein
MYFAQVSPITDFSKNEEEKQERYEQGNFDWLENRGC